MSTAAEATSSSMQYVRFGKTGLRVSELGDIQETICSTKMSSCTCFRCRVFALDACRMVPPPGILGRWNVMNP